MKSEENDNRYFYEFDKDNDQYVVFYGVSEPEFKASYVAQFAEEEDASDYVEYKNDILNPVVGDIEPLLKDFEGEAELLDPEWDDQGIEDLVTHFNKEVKDGWD